MTCPNYVRSTWHHRNFYVPCVGRVYVGTTVGEVGEGKMGGGGREMESPSGLANPGPSCKLHF